MSKYYEWEEFKYIYLEDSFVLRIEEAKNEISFTIDVVLTSEHPMYTSPKKNEQYSYKNGKLVFQGLKSIKWLDRSRQSFTDADGIEDYGNIDSFELSSEGCYHLKGDWGEVVIDSNFPKLHLGNLDA
ncbi:hypothetical protein [Vreelandella sp. EE27]